MPLTITLDDSYFTWLNVVTEAQRAYKDVHDRCKQVKEEIEQAKSSLCTATNEEEQTFFEEAIMDSSEALTSLEAEELASSKYLEGVSVGLGYELTRCNYGGYFSVDNKEKKAKKEK